MKRRTYGAWLWALSVTCLLAAPAWAQQEQQEKRQQQNEAGQQPSQQGGAQQSGGQPEFFDRLNLTEEQQTRIKEILSKYEQKTKSAWEEFHRLHMKAVAMEAALIASLDSSLSEEQKQRLAESRREQRQQRRELGYRDRETQDPNAQDQDANRRQERREERREGRQADEDQDRQSRREERQERREQGREDQAGQQTSDQPGQEDEAWSLIVIEVAPADPSYGQLDLSDEQRQRQQSVSSAYTQRIRETWKQLHQMHAQMVKSEAQKLAELEKMLTEEQLRQLHDLRGKSQQRGQDGARRQ